MGAVFAAPLNYLKFLSGSWMFKKTYVEKLMKVSRRVPGGRREDESEVNREAQHLSSLPTSLFPRWLSPACLAFTLAFFFRLPTSAVPKYDISYPPISELIFGASSFSLTRRPLSSLTCR